MHSLPADIAHRVTRIKRKHVGLVCVILVVRIVRAHSQQRLLPFDNIVDHNRLAGHRVGALIPLNPGRIGQERAGLRTAVRANEPVLQTAFDRASLGRPGRMCYVAIDPRVNRRRSGAAAAARGIADRRSHVGCRRNVRIMAAIGVTRSGAMVILVICQVAHYLRNPICIQVSPIG